MKPNLSFLAFTILAFSISVYSQANLEVEGPIQIGYQETTTPEVGTLRFNPNTSDLEGWNGFYWASLTGLQYEVGMVTDIDSNEYATVRIGNEYWMAENLKVTRYRDGSDIPHLIDDSLWQSANYGAYAFYNHADSLEAIYGKLYNWFAVNDTRGLCPDGWHVPDTSEWNDMYRGLGLQNEVGGYLKSRGIDLWDPPNTGATNTSGFTGLPAGIRNTSGGFVLERISAYWWSSTSTAFPFAKIYHIYYFNTNLFIQDFVNTYGLSVRCIQD